MDTTRPTDTTECVERIDRIDPRVAEWDRTATPARPYALPTGIGAYILTVGEYDSTTTVEVVVGTPADADARADALTVERARRGRLGTGDERRVAPDLIVVRATPAALHLPTAVTLAAGDHAAPADDDQPQSIDDAMLALVDADYLVGDATEDER